MTRLSEYQSNFVKDEKGMAKTVFLENAEYRKTKKYKEIHHTPISWMDEDIGKIFEIVSRSSRTYTPPTPPSSTRTDHKAIQASSKPIEMKEVAVQYPLKTKIENRDFKKNSFKSRYNSPRKQPPRSKDVSVQSPARVTSLEVNRFGAIYNKKNIKPKPSLPIQSRPMQFYGWADTFSPWQKKTYNVKAPSLDVRPSALRAANYREQNRKSRCLSAQERSKQELQNLVLLNKKQDASTQFTQWETEYSSQFCK